MPKAKVKTKGIPSPHHYVYPTGTLKNKYGIQDLSTFLKRYSRDVEEEVRRLNQESLPSHFDSSYLCYIHKKLFHHMFEWAGQLRNVPFTFADGTVAAMPEILESEWGNVYASGNEIHENLQKMDQILLEKDNLQDLSREEFVHEAAELFASLHRTAPFRIGNRHVRQVFFEKLGAAAGHPLDFSLATQESMIVASVKATEEGDLEPLKSLFEHISNPERALKERISLTEMPPKEHVSPEQQRTLKEEDEAALTVPKTGEFDNILIPGKKIPPLMKTEIDTLVKEDPYLREGREQIQALSKVIYGKSEILDKRMMQIIENPSSVYKLVNHIEAAPHSVGKLAGINFCGLKNAKRKRAEESVDSLVHAMVGFAHTAKQIQREIIKDYQKEQERCAKEVRMPSVNLQDLLSLPKEAQREVLAQSPVLSQELNDFVLALHGRLSPDEQKTIKKGDHKELATMMGVSEEKAKQIASVAQKTKAAHLHSQTCKIRQAKGLAVAS